MSFPRENEKILKGHKKVGSCFIPPMKQISKMRNVSYVDDLLPELIWLGLINDRLGLASGSHFFQKIVKVVDKSTKAEGRTNCALATTYKSFTPEEKKTIIKNLGHASLLTPLQKHLAPLTLLYDEFPLRFIGPPETVYTEALLIKLMKKCVSRHLDKYETPGIILNGAVLLARLVTKSIHFAPHIKLPDFNSVLTDPDSEEARRAAGMMRSNALSEIGATNLDNSWSRYFWDKGYEISECEFGEENNE